MQIESAFFARYSGRLPAWQLGLQLLVLPLAAWAGYAPNCSSALSLAAAIASQIPFIPFHLKASRENPFPPATGSGGEMSVKSAALLLGLVALAGALMVASAHAAHALVGLDAGPWFWVAIYSEWPMWIALNCWCVRPEKRPEAPLSATA